MASLIDITPATESDYPLLARILSQAMSIDPVSLCIFTTPPYDLSVPEKLGTMMIAREAAQPNSHVLKATLKATREIVAFAIWSVVEEEEEAAEEEEEGEKAKAEMEMEKKDGDDAGGPGEDGGLPEGINADFFMMYLGSLGEKYQMHMAGEKKKKKKHAVLNQLHVTPSQQRKGIGSAMLRHGLKELRLDQLPIWLVTQPRGRNLYRLFGWGQVDCIEIDMSVWKGVGTGFGVHENPCMVREPGSLGSN
ncbi:MAG: hypothetical protein MMC33_005035 [Icmadophila ericetorum]|nr:hypothetical protein [Icmadophila ericetorum]